MNSYSEIEDRIDSIIYDAGRNQGAALNRLDRQLAWVMGQAETTHQAINSIMGKNNVLSEMTFSDPLYFEIQAIQQAIIHTFIKEQDNGRKKEEKARAMG